MSYLRAPGIEPTHNTPRAPARRLRRYVYLATICPRWEARGVRAQTSTFSWMPNLATYVHINILRIIPKVPNSQIAFRSMNVLKLTQF